MKKQDNRKSDVPGLMKESEHTEHSGHSGFPEVPKNPKKQRMECLKVYQRMRPMDDTFMRKLFRDNQPLVEHLLRIVTGDDALGRLMHDFQCSDPDEMLDEMMAESTRRCKNDRKVVNEMCDIIEEYGNEMMARGEERSLVKSVKTLMLTMHMTVGQAMDALKVPEDRRSSIVQHVQ